MKSKKVKITIIAILTIVVLFFVFNSFRKGKQTVEIETTKVQLGNIRNTISATGTIQAIKTVEVGTQVSGVISKIYVDYNSIVKKGQLLVEIDKTQLNAMLENAEASLEEAKAEVSFQTSNYNRIKAMFEKDMISETEYDQALYNYTRSQASYKMSKSNYDKAKINLEYASIYSPIDGVVLYRAVAEGQTVAASFNTPTLFTIANDLTQMQVEANIDEADIGQVKNGQFVEFTVDAFPDMKFNGEVTEIRLKPVTTSNVVTYTVIIKAPNPEKKLMPGMTANINVVVEKSDSVFTLPSKALRFSPDETVIKTYYADKKNPKHLDNSALVKEKNQKNENTIWIKKGEDIYPKNISIGITDGINTEIKSGISENENVILSMEIATLQENTKEKSSSPFIPKRPGSKSK